MDSAGNYAEMEINEFHAFGETISDQAAILIASWFMSPGTSGEEFSRLAHYGWPKEGLCEAIENEMAHGGHTGQDLAALQALMAWAEEQLPPITSVDTSYGHRFESVDEPLAGGCIQCGAEFSMVRDPEYRSHAYYVGPVLVISQEEGVMGHESPIKCPGAEAGWIHGYERYCRSEECASLDEACGHSAHNCNCRLCD